MAAAAEPFDDLASADLGPLLQRIGDARLVLLGEASHGTSEFYRMRARITQALIEEKGLRLRGRGGGLAGRGGDRRVRAPSPGRPAAPQAVPAVPALDVGQHGRHGVRPLAARVQRARPLEGPRHMAGFHGIDLYSMHASAEAVLRYLDDVDPEAAAVARDRYECLMPWQNDPVLYGRAC
jgi:erythromycin esterase-like protein